MGAFLKKYWSVVAMLCAGVGAMVGTIHNANPLVADGVAVAVALLAWLAQSPLPPTLPEVEKEVESVVVPAVEKAVVPVIKFP